MSETPQQYVQRVLGYLEGREPLDILEHTPIKLAKLVSGQPDDRLSKPPGAGKWSVRQILAHLADTEIVKFGPDAIYQPIIGDDAGTALTATASSRTSSSRSRCRRSKAIAPRTTRLASAACSTASKNADWRNAPATNTTAASSTVRSPPKA